MNIGTINITGHTVLAPLAGITNLPFRRIVKRCGCSLLYSEMISAKALLYNSDKTLTLLQTVREERPLTVQIFGSVPSEMAKAALIIEKKGVADIIDINFGCSVKKVIKTGAGVALMQNTSNAEEIIKAVRDTISIPLTIKIRTGWESSGIQAFKIAQLAQKFGVNAIALHPRTASQGFRGESDWSLIKKLKSDMAIPLIGNGDIVCAEDGVRMIKETGCDAVMVGRGAMANPFILSDIEAMISCVNSIFVSNYDRNILEKSKNDSSDENLLRTNYNFRSRSPKEIFFIMKELLLSSSEYFGEIPSCKMMRSRLAWFVKGWPRCSEFRHSLSNIESVSQAIKIIDEYQKFLLIEYYNKQS